MLVVTLPIAAGAVVLGPGLLTALFGARFGPSVLPFQILVWNLVASAISSVYKLLVLLMNGKQREYLLVIGLVAGLGVALNLGFIWLWSYNGAAIARVVTESAAAAISAVIARRFVRTRFWGAFVRVGLATTATALTWFALGAIGLPTWLVIPGGAALYVPALFLFGGINSSDVAIVTSMLRVSPVPS
jgi:O-antigen/teichoic acid export membrane protein